MLVIDLDKNIVEVRFFFLFDKKLFYLLTNI